MTEKKICEKCRTWIDGWSITKEECFGDLLLYHPACYKHTNLITAFATA